MVGVMGGAMTDQEWQALLDDSFLLDAEAAKQGKDSIHIVLAEADLERPGAVIRRKIADARPRYKTNHRCIAFVTGSSLLKGLLTVINWLTPALPSEDITFLATFQEANDWAQKKRAAKLPMLKDLYEETQQKRRMLLKIQPR